MDVLLSAIHGQRMQHLFSAAQPKSPFSIRPHSLAHIKKTKQSRPGGYKKELSLASNSRHGRTLSFNG